MDMNRFTGAQLKMLNSAFLRQKDIHQKQF